MCGGEIAGLWVCGGGECRFVGVWRERLVVHHFTLANILIIVWTHLFVIALKGSKLCQRAVLWALGIYGHTWHTLSDLFVIATGGATSVHSSPLSPLTIRMYSLCLTHMEYHPNSMSFYSQSLCIKGYKGDIWNSFRDNDTTFIIH